MTATFSLGMESYNNTLYGPLGTSMYTTQKGIGQLSNPVAITAGHIRPLTNNDPTNNATYVHGAARPQKWQYRNETQSRVPFTSDTTTNYNSRVVRSSTGSSMIKQLIDTPGGFKVMHNPSNEIDETSQLNLDCATCEGRGLVTDYFPSRNLTDNPEPVSVSPQFCCNDQRKALKNVRSYGNTILKKNYYQTTKQYLQNRCQTFEQRAFNFYSGPAATQTIDPVTLLAAKPGSPNAIFNTYVASCYPSTCNVIPNLSGQPNNSSLSCLNPTVDPNILNPYYQTPIPTSSTGCKLVVYKPNNPQFAVQGGVSSSTRTFKLGVTTLEKNSANTRIYQGSSSINRLVNVGGIPYTPFVYKNKTPACSPGLSFYWQGNVQTNPKTCIKRPETINLSNDQQNQLYSKWGGLSPNVNTNGISTNWSGIT